MTPRAAFAGATSRRWVALAAAAAEPMTTRAAAVAATWRARAAAVTVRALKTDPARALALTNRQQALSPMGSLAEEREFIAIEASKSLEPSSGFGQPSCAPRAAGANDFSPHRERLGEPRDEIRILRRLAFAAL